MQTVIKPVELQLMIGLESCAMETIPNNYVIFLFATTTKCFCTAKFQRSESENCATKEEPPANKQKQEQ